MYFRARLWLQACGIKKNISSQKLYNNYRVCSKHFASHMFLNDLKNRLQPHAVPSTVFDTNVESTTTQNKINSKYFSIMKYINIFLFVC